MIWAALSTQLTLGPFLAVLYAYFLHPQAFTRTVQQEPDNGDAWANIAAVHLQHQNWRPAFAAAAEVRHPLWAVGPTGALSKILDFESRIRNMGQGTHLLLCSSSHARLHVGRAEAGVEHQAVRLCQGVLWQQRLLCCAVPCRCLRPA